MIKGEYWIIDGDVDFADGDVGDYNHEALAIDHVFRSWSDNVASVAEEYGIETDFNSDDYADTESITNTINEILEIIQEDHNEEDSNTILMQQLGITEPAYLVICGFGDARDYVMQYEGWIALRGNSSDLYGFDAEKRKSLAEGVEQIL